MIDISRCDKAKVVYALYVSARGPSGPVTEENIRQRIASGQTYFSTLGSKVLKIDVSGNVLDPTLYDDNNGVAFSQGLTASKKYKGKAQAVLEAAGLVGFAPGSSTGSRLTAAHLVGGSTRAVSPSLEEAQIEAAEVMAPPVEIEAEVDTDIAEEETGEETGGTLASIDKEDTPTTQESEHYS
jgi:hypothetical protein